MEAQTTIAFPESAKPVRKRIIRKGAIDRYNLALDYLRLELSPEKPTAIKADEFAHVFGISTTFISLVKSFGAIQKVGTENGSYTYIKLPKLTTITGVELLNYRIEEFPNPEYTPDPDKVNPTAIAPAGFNIPQSAVDTPNGTTNTTQEPVYLVGALEPDNTRMKLQTCKNAQFNDYETAKACMDAWPVLAGMKVVMLQVVEVVQMTISKQNCEL